MNQMANPVAEWGEGETASARERR